MWWSQPCSRGGKSVTWVETNFWLVTTYEHFHVVALCGEEINVALMKPVQKVKFLSKALPILTASAIYHSYLGMLPGAQSSVPLSNEVPK